MNVDAKERKTKRKTRYRALKTSFNKRRRKLEALKVVPRPARTTSQPVDRDDEDADTDERHWMNGD